MKELPPVRKRVTIVNAGKTYVGVYSVKGDLLAVRSGTALRTAVVSKRYPVNFSTPRSSESSDATSGARLPLLSAAIN